MRAVRQGAFDGLCGLYAIVNAVERVGIKGPRSAFHKSLFLRLAKAIPAHGLHRVLGSGIEADELAVVARRAFRTVQRDYDIKLTIRRPLMRSKFTQLPEFLSWFDEIARDQRHAIVVNVVMPWVDHWTVVDRQQGPHLLVRDSSGLRPLDIQRFRIRGGSYRIRIHQTLVIERIGGPDHVRAEDLIKRCRP